MVNNNVGKGLTAILVIITAVIVFSQVFIPVVLGSVNEFNQREVSGGEGETKYIVCDCDDLANNASTDNSLYININNVETDYPDNVTFDLYDGKREIYKYQDVTMDEGETRDFEFPPGNVTVEVENIGYYGTVRFAVDYPNKFYYNKNVRTLIGLTTIFIMAGVLIVTIPLISEVIQ